MGKALFCRWSKETPSGLNFSDYELLHLIIEDGQSMVVIPGSPENLTEKGFLFRVASQAFSVGKRQARRYAGNEVSVELIQSGIVATGRLLDFSHVGFRVSITSEISDSNKWFNIEASVTIQLRYLNEVVLSANCRCVRKEGVMGNLEVVLAPAQEKISRYKKRQFRNHRQCLLPPPVLTFFHPLLNKQVRLAVSDISTSGFSVYETPQESLLLQGMIIPELTIEFFGALQLRCSAQVLYRLEDQKGIRCGITILDMDVNSYSRLSHILYNALDPNSHISQRLDLDALWEFLFESGFIYPLKYKIIQSHRNEFKRTYKKLYQQSPEIAKHITYQRHGRIEGHISMVRVYEKAWMIHHHASRKSGGRMAGLKVLKDLMLYLNDMHRLPSANMDYALCYYSPEKKFPDKLFGGFARELREPRGCSLDLFTYYPSTTQCEAIHCPSGWALRECSTRDIWELSQFYSYRSGGLFLDVIGLSSAGSGENKLGSVYKRHGLMRKWHAYSLDYEGRLCAVLILDQSDLGINLSELINSIKVFVIDTDTGILTWNIISFAVGELR
ncbi:MAG: PilZ domain-containing protein, partial [Deltaproteobacteria bacterium]